MTEKKKQEPEGGSGGAGAYALPADDALWPYASDLRRRHEAGASVKELREYLAAAWRLDRSEQAIRAALEGRTK